MSVFVPNHRMILPSSFLIGKARDKNSDSSVLSAERKCILPRFAADPCALDPFDHTLNMVGVMDFLPAPTLHLGEGGSGVVEPALVEPKKPPFFISHPSELCDVIRQRVETRFALLYLGGTGFKALRDSISCASEDDDSKCSQNIDTEPNLILNPCQQIPNDSEGERSRNTRWRLPRVLRRQAGRTPAYNPVPATATMNVT